MLLSFRSILNLKFRFCGAGTGSFALRKGMNLGADDYLVKPFSGDELLGLVMARLKKAEIVKELAQQNVIDDGLMFTKAMTDKSLFSANDKVQIKKLRKKDTLYFEGDSARYIYYIISGRIKTIQTNEQGKEYITQLYTNENFLGFQAMLGKDEYHDTAVVAEDSEVACIMKQDFQQLLVTNRELYGHFVTFLTSELNESNQRLLGLAYNSARKRVAEAILFLAKKKCPSLEEPVDFVTSREEISGVSGVSPESVSRNLTDFKDEKLVDFHNGKITIRSIQRLAALKN